MRRRKKVKRKHATGQLGLAVASGAGIAIAAVEAVAAPEFEQPGQPGQPGQAVKAPHLLFVPKNLPQRSALAR
jgi:hypothetical protein